MKVRVTVLFTILFVSCSSRKVNKHNEKTEIYKSEHIENVDIVKKNIVMDITNNIDVFILNNEFTITPVDSSRPMKIGFKEFKNVKITSKTNQTTQTSSIKEKQVDNSQTVSHNNYQAEENVLYETNSKETERSSNYWYWFVLILIMFLIYRVYKKYMI